MSPISSSLLLLCFLVSSMHSLRLHSQSAGTALPETPSDMKNLNLEEIKVNSKLQLVRLLLANSNTTISSNVY